MESLGIPLPGETIVIAAGVYAGSTHRLSVWLVFVVASVAAIVGNAVGFWLGEVGGYRLLLRYGRRVRIDETRIKIGRYVFDRHGGKVVFFGRFISVLRTYVAFLAGTSQMRWRSFLLHSTSAALAWAGLYSFGSDFLGKAISVGPAGRHRHRRSRCDRSRCRRCRGASPYGKTRCSGGGRLSGAASRPAPLATAQDARRQGGTVVHGRNRRALERQDGRAHLLVDNGRGRGKG